MSGGGRDAAHGLSCVEAVVHADAVALADQADTCLDLPERFRGKG